jgi:hypothetical protein
MDYGALIQQAWRLTWRYRFLWVLGLFVPGATGSCSGGSGGNVNPGDFDQTPGRGGGLPPDLDRAGAQFGRWIEQNLWVIVAAVGLILLIALALLIVSFIAQGGMARATAAVAQGEPMTAGEAWRSGLALFWRFVGLWLIQIGIGIAFLIGIGVVALIFVALGAATDGGGRAGVIALGVLLGLALLVALIPLLIAYSVVLVYAQRAMAIEGVGPFDGLGRGARLLRANLGASALTWLLMVGIGIAIAIGVTIALIILVLPLIGVGFGIYAASGFSTGLFTFAAVALLLVIAVAWLISGVANAYSWSYWTLAYLRLTGRLTPQLLPAGVAGAAGPALPPPPPASPAPPAPPAPDLPPPPADPADR